MAFYYGSDGERIENPNEDDLKDIFFHTEASYWEQGSGDSSIEVDGCDECLLFFYDEPYGFFMMRHPDYLVPIDRDVAIKTVEHDVGGDPMKVPTCSYVDRETAYKIAKEFIETEKIPEFLEWIDLYDIDFDHDYR